MATFAPAAAAAEPPPLLVDGTEKTLPSGSYETTADSHVGLRVTNGGRATGTDIDIATAGKSAHAAEIITSSSFASLTGGTLRTTGDSAYGLHVANGGGAALENVTILTKGGSAMGANFRGAETRGQFRGGRIETIGYGATGIDAANGGSFSLEGGTKVSTEGEAARGLLVSGGGGMEANTATIETSGRGSHGLHVDNGSSATLTGTTIATSGWGAQAIKAGLSSGLITVGEGSRLLTEGDDSVAVNVENGARLVVRSSHIETSGTNAPAVYDRAAFVELQNTDVVTHGNLSFGVTAKGGDYAGTYPQIDVRGSRIETRGGSAHGAVASFGGRLELFDTTIKTSGAKSHGLLVNAGAVNARNIAIDTMGVDAYGIAIQYGGTLAFVGGSVLGAQAAIRLNDAGAIRFGGGAQLQGQSGVFAEVVPTSVQPFTLVLEDKAQAIGDIRLSAPPKPTASDETKLSLAIHGEAIWVGASSIVRGLSLERGGTWIVAGDSHVDTLRNDHGVVAFASATPGVFGTLTIAGDYEGNEGLFRMRGQLGGDGSPTDRIHVMGNTSGTSFIAVDALDGAGDATTDGIRLVQVDGRSDGRFELSGRAVAGAYEYFLHQGSVSRPGDGSWYLRSSLTDPILEPGEGEEPTGPLDPVDPVDPIVRPAVLRPETGTYRANQVAALDMFQAGPGAGRDDEQDASRGSGWARFERRHTAFDLGRQITTTTATNELTLGTDLFQGGGEVESHLGIMAATGRSDTRGMSLLTRYSAKGRVTGAAGGVYGGLRTATGSYLRGWIQHARFNQRVEGDALAGERYDSRTLTTSIEAGHRWRKALNRDTDVYLEPQAQVVATRLRGGRHTEAGGTRVASRHASGATARLGMRAAGRWHTPGGHVASPYFTGSWLRRLGRLDATQFNDAMFADGVPRNAYALKLGLAMLRHDGWRLWGDVETRFGASRYRRVAGTLGVRKNW
ncbi:autotransporter outer membrane beta-barrel domain-containing protein [Luteibacter yeojuensis]|uniref:Autotransporter outer membrane beta-barrel domain-containing protein n=1 Tax=Luteibacter yeojuensis TaxID=345309 RepID=A0A7X5QXE8_9GAMM|nr:autotransporter outer membrane beta-barrel domain-containing protein [Luteibacter yeojuensis]NID17198.1 autotransporter outer membrane beta-barrel domain-containing protein [Luteibacter yeojuensis]